MAHTILLQQYTYNMITHALLCCSHYRLRLRLRESQAFYLIIGKKTMVSNSLTLGEVYNSEKDSDGFIYMTYASQEVFG